MFIKAIETATQFTKPIHTIERFYGSEEINPGAATLFIVNSEGWALTCKHVAGLLIAGDQLAKRKTNFDSDLAAMRGKKKEKQIIKDLQHKYNLNNKTLFEIKSLFFNCIDGKLDLEIKAHPDLDVALIKFKNFTKLVCSNFPIFPKDTTSLKQGKYLCRLGFPFPEFTNFELDKTKDTINWTKVGRENTPIFPIEGMVTRHLVGKDGKIIGFEMSTPGLRGQSGGPAFDVDGKVWGMQSATNHLDLNFDVDMEVFRSGQKKRIHESAILHVGHCVHVDILKSFMKQHDVAYKEE